MQTDTISRSAALETINEVDISDCTDVDDIIDRVYADVASVPTIDAVPVVRCKDCENTDPAIGLPEGMFYCNEWESTTRGHWYCCRGEKKEEA